MESNLTVARLNFHIESDKSPEKIKELLEAYVNEACSKLENDGLSLTYDLVIEEW